MSIEQINGATLITFNEDRLDKLHAVQFKDRMKEIIINNSNKIALDMSKIGFMDSSGLGAIVNSLKLVGPDGEIVLANVNQPVRQMLDLTRMVRVFRIADSVSEALDYLNTK
ncbi:MAG: STAS domain-containing protein [Bacteroidota bacterium]